MSTSARARPFLQLGFAFVLVAVVGAGFLLETLQAAYSPFALALPSGPFEQLVSEAYRFAVASFVFAALVPYVDASRSLGGLTKLFAFGAFAKLTLLAFAAANGMMAIQASDPRAIAPKLFTIRMIANALVLVAVAWAAFLLLRRERAPESSS